MIRQASAHGLCFMQTTLEDRLSGFYLLRKIIGMFSQTAGRRIELGSSLVLPSRFGFMYSLAHLLWSLRASSMKDSIYAICFVSFATSAVR
jgi:hypothetical protein